jgi:hypothetical protein
VKFVKTNCDVCGEFAKCVRFGLLSTSLPNRRFLDFCLACVLKAVTMFLGGGGK